MYMDQLEVRRLEVDSIFLDPNNPRFWTEQNTRVVPDKKVPEDKVQSEARTRIDRHDIDELYNSILRNGFLLLDRIVVRPLKGLEGKYVVVEGNRRFRSLSKLRDDITIGTISEDGIDEEYLDRLKAATDSIETLIYSGTASGDISGDISWMLQGIRHIGGIKPWDPAQRAKLVAEQIDVMNQSFRSAGQQFGLTPQAVGRYYRTYKALQQMRADEEFGSKARNDFFSLFEESYRNVNVRKWLGWDDEQRLFANADNLKRFYSWILPDEEADGKRRIHDPHQIKELSYLIEHSPTLLTEFENHDIAIGEAVGRAKAGGAKPKDWHKAIESALAIVSELPQSAMFDETADFIVELERLSAVITKRLEAARKLVDA